LTPGIDDNATKTVLTLADTHVKFGDGGIDETYHIGLNTLGASSFLSLGAGASGWNGGPSAMFFSAGHPLYDQYIRFTADGATELEYQHDNSVWDFQNNTIDAFAVTANELNTPSLSAGLTLIGGTNTTQSPYIEIHASNELGPGNDLQYTVATVDQLYYDWSASSWDFKDNHTLQYSVFLKEQSAALGDVATYGQIWVKDNGGTQELWWTSDVGADVQLGVGGGGGSPLTTKGDLYGFSTVNARVPVGTNGQVLTANSAQPLGVEWAAALSDVVNDVTPQLGGDLDVNGNDIVSASGGDIAITPDTTGNVIIDGIKHPQADGSTGQVLQTDGLGQLSFASISGGSSPSTGYGSVYADSNAVTTTFAGSSTDWTNKVQVTVFDTNGTSSTGVTPDHTNDHVTIGNAGPYLLHASISFSGTANETLSFAFFKNNGATQLGNRTTRKLGTGGDVGACDISAAVDLSASDTIELWVQNEGSTGAITIQDINFEVVGLTGLGAIVEDVTPQLGGNLDVNGNSIVSVSAGDINITPDTTGNIVLDGQTWPNAIGANGYFLQTDGAGTLSWAAAGGGSTFIGLSDTPSSYSGQANKWVKVSSGATSLVFTSSPVTSTSVVAPLVKVGTTTPQYSIPAAAGPSTDGYMTGSDKAKLDAIDSGADVTANELVAGNGVSISGSTVSTDYTLSTSAPSGTPSGGAGHVWYRY
jgi:hypothetical protein